MSDEKGHCKEISLDEAIQLTRQYVNKYKAFEKVHAVLELARMAEQRADEADKRHKKLMEEMDATRSTLKDLDNSVNEARLFGDKAQDALTERKAKLQEDYDEAATIAMADHATFLEKLVTDRREAEGAHILAMNDLKADEETARTRVDELRSTLDTLKKQAQAATGG
ncbi:MAG: hypothetical protein KAR40_09635 [Candidatus Sabulitectum sp.]|nr:hypothetical protein [Candidatus Sabulitectum sp.]